jgi:hypothetical protein
MYWVIDKLVEVLSASPEPVLSAGSLGVKKPSTGNEIPAIVMSLTIEDYKGTGIGRLVRTEAREKEEVFEETYRGSLILEIWAHGFDATHEISEKLQNKLKSSSTLLKQKGFLKLQPARLEPVENVLHHPPVGSPFPVWKQPLGYRFVFESEEGREVSSGLIKRIQVDMGQQPHEAFSVPPSTHKT